MKIVNTVEEGVIDNDICVNDSESNKNVEFDGNQKYEESNYFANGEDYKDYVKNNKDNIKEENNMSKITRSLSLECYGINSRKIYIDLCQKFDWDRSQEGNFGRQGVPLYAEGATPEGYSVWFLGHSNWTVSEGGSWENEILDDLVIETWKKQKDDLYKDKTKRVLFAKNQNHQYVF